MTAIAGLWRFDHADTQSDCGRMLAAQAIYGPHHEAQWNGDAIALGRRLFRTLPEDRHDRGPVIGANGDVLVADVRLDNREELADALKLPPGRIAMMSDAQMLMAALERWDEDAIDRMVGDFAFALWSPARQRLLLARDFLGQRPLHYHRGDGFFAFASMPKGLHALPDVPYAPDETRMAEFLALMPESGSASFFAGIERVEAGHMVRVSPSGVIARRYWNPEPKPILLADAQAYMEALRGHMDAAVKARLRGSDSGVATHLSGGFDSATVTATAARLLTPSGGRVTAFTSVPRHGYDGPDPKNRIGDEGPLAAATAYQHANIDHVPVSNSGRSPLANLERYFFLYERPFLNLCNGVWIDDINDRIKARRMTVLLTGQMGNMSISHTGLPLLPQLLRKGRWLRLWREARALVANRNMRWSGVGATTLGPFLPKPLWQWLSRLADKEQDIGHYSAIQPDRHAELEDEAAKRGLDFTYRPWADSFAMRVWVMRRVDLGNFNKGVLAGWGIDQRDPTADKRLVEFCLNVPDEQFLRDGQMRALAQQAFADRLPAVVLEEKRKGLQAVDWHENLAAARQEAMEEVARLDNCTQAARALDRSRMQKLLAQMPADGWERNGVMQAYRLALLRGISSGHFLRKASRSNA